jgi:hypothetical protein
MEFSQSLIQPMRGAEKRRQAPGRTSEAVANRQSRDYGDREMAR